MVVDRRFLAKGGQSHCDPKKPNNRQVLVLVIYCLFVEITRSLDFEMRFLVSTKQSKIYAEFMRQCFE